MDRASIITSLVVGFGTIGALVHETRMHKFLEQERRKHESHLLDLYIFEKKYDTQVDLLAGKSHQEYSKCMSTIHSFIHKTNHDHTPKAVMVLADARKRFVEKGPYLIFFSIFALLSVQIYVVVTQQCRISPNAFRLQKTIGFLSICCAEQLRKTLFTSIATHVAFYVSDIILSWRPSNVWMRKRRKIVLCTN